MSKPKICSDGFFEANIYDQRRDPVHGSTTSSDFARVMSMPKAGSKWNTFVITAKDTNLIVKSTGVQHVNINDSMFASGPIALQFGNAPKDASGSVIKWRMLQITAP